MKEQLKTPFNIIVIVAALGYFVDIYDLILFGIIRVKSLNGLGITDPQQITDMGINLINLQMIGMLTGGIIWGIMGDKKGRVSVLFGSILLYSIANIANAYVQEIADMIGVSGITAYGWMRFVAGVGLAGELGAGITLVNEVMTKEHRGYGTMIVVSFGVLGAVAANLVSFVQWQTSYIIGGIMGLVLLMLRIGVYESGLYANVKESNIKKGNLLMLFSNWERFLKYLSCIAIGIPIWYMIGVLVILSPEISKSLGIEGVKPGDAIMYFYAATSFGDFMSGYLSQVFKSRKKIVFLYLMITVIMTPVYLYTKNISAIGFYVICGFLGIAAGYWAVFVTTASEQFGTNLRATVTTTVPNFVRGSLTLLTLLLNLFRNMMGYDIITSCLLVGIISILIAFAALFGLKETYGKDLNFVEE